MSSLNWHNLLRAYALIELIIGIAGALSHPIYVGLTGSFAYDQWPSKPIRKHRRTSIQNGAVVPLILP